MPRAKAMAGRSPAVVPPPAAPELEEAEGGQGSDEGAEAPVPAAPVASMVMEVGNAPARGIEAVIREREASGAPVPVLAEPARPVTAEPAADVVRASFRPFQALVLGAKAKDENYVPPEERANPDYREKAEREQKEQQEKNLAKARQAFGLDSNVKVVFPSENMGRQAAKHTW